MLASLALALLPQTAPAVHVRPITHKEVFTQGHALLDFEDLPLGSGLQPYTASSGVTLMQVGGQYPIVWQDSTLTASGLKASGFAGQKPTLNQAIKVVNLDPGLWPSPMPALGGTPTALPNEAVLAIYFDAPVSRVGFDVHSLDPHAASMLLTPVANGVPLGTVYLDATSTFSHAGAESSTTFDELRVDLVNPQTGSLSLDNLRYELLDEDLDLDGVADFADVCVGLHNPLQSDLDMDGIGDECDAWPQDPFNDFDGDGLPFQVDNCPETYNPFQEDADGDGIGDPCDAFPLLLDSDGDGIDDTVDNCVTTFNPQQTDCDADGVGDVCDTNFVSPTAVSLSLAPGESATVSSTICIPPMPALADILIAIDTTGSMGGEINALKSAIVDVVLNISETLPTDIQLGLAQFRDYNQSYTSCGYSGTYGDPGDMPFEVIQPMTAATTTASLVNSINSLTASGGGDSAESYARAFWEIAQPDSGINFRNGSARYVLMFGDERPHDCELGEELSCVNSNSTGVDPGRDEALFTADDLDWHDQAVAAMLAENIRVLTVCSSSASKIWCSWQGWSKDLFGNSMQINTDGTLMEKQSILVKLTRLIAEKSPFSDHGLVFNSTPSQLQLVFTPNVISGPLSAASGPIPFDLTVTVPASLPAGTTSLSTTVYVLAGGTPLGTQAVDVTILP